VHVYFAVAANAKNAKGQVRVSMLRAFHGTGGSFGARSLGVHLKYIFFKEFRRSIPFHSIPQKCNHSIILFG
jgi:hypothetical protein